MLNNNYPERLFLFAALIAFFSGAVISCRQAATVPPAHSFQQDSLKIEALLAKGDSIYSQRSSMHGIGESLLYFDSAHKLAQQLGDKKLLAYTLYFIGNVYNAWNGEPDKTIDYYSRAEALFAQLPGNHVKEFYLRYLIAHGYDSEKGNDSVRCVQTIGKAINDLKFVAATTIDSMDYLPDFAWVATNAKNYPLAESILNNLPFRPVNDPQSNNYLDHYYLSKARIDIYHYHRPSGYLDSLSIALAKCNNRFDSAYYSMNLAKLYAENNDHKKAFRFMLLNNTIQNNLDKSDILSSLRTRLLNSELAAGKEKEQRTREEIKIKNLYLYGGGLLLIILLLLAVLYNIYQKREHSQTQIVQQEAFTRQLLQKEEAERKRIAMELHDGINHELLTLKNNLLLSKPVVTTDVEDIIRSVREVSRRLYPAMFENVGLQASVEALCKNMTEAGFFTTSDITYLSQPGKEEELQLYRIIQEALHNVSKHAQAEACKISIGYHNDKLIVEIKDNGRGFNVNLAAANCFGLQSMQQRAKAINAQLLINSSPAGTVITLTKTLV